MSEELKLLFYLLLFGLPVLANLLEKSRKKRLENERRRGGGVSGRTRKAPAPRGTTGQRPTLAEWIEELRRQSAGGGNVDPTPAKRPLQADVMVEEPADVAATVEEVQAPTPPPLAAPEEGFAIQPEESPLADAALLADSEDLADAMSLANASAGLESPSSKKKGLVLDRGEVQRAIVMREVLGPPRALVIMGRKGWTERI